MLKGLRPFFASLLLLAVVTQAGAADKPRADPAEPTYRNAIANARMGNHTQALTALESLVMRFPQRNDIRGDYAVILGWAGRHEDAVAQLDRVDRATAPAQVLEGIAGSARRTKQFDLAESLYRQAMSRFPQRVEPRVGLALTLADAGKADEAAAMLATLRKQHPANIEVLDAVAYVAIPRREYFVALDAYQRILAIDPKNRNALRGKILVLSRIGAPHLAVELADSNPEVLAPGERESIGTDRTAHSIRWGIVAADQARGPERFAALDKAIAESDAAGTRALDQSVELTQSERVLAYDRVVALRDRYRMAESVALYEALAARGDVPAYVKAPAAGAYLHLRQPKKARDLFEASLAENPNNLEAEIGLFYAYAESEDHKAALAQIDKVVEKTPRWIDAWSPVTRRENPDYARVLAAQAAAPLYANQPGKTEERLRQLISEAPANLSLRLDHAGAMRARGWPRKAAHEINLILALEIDNARAYGEYAGALLESRNYSEARVALRRAQDLAAEEGAVVRTARLMQVHDMRELTISGNYGKSSGGGPAGTRDFALETWLYSSPIHENYRVFAHLYNAQSKFEAGTARRNRAGAGLEYRNPLWIVTGELAQDISASDFGGALTVAFTPDDHWTFRTKLDSSPNETPLQARLAGVKARRIMGEAVWRAHESRTAGISLDHYHFSDGNDRFALQASWRERVYAGPVYRLEVVGGLFASRNSETGVAYFNPSRDFAPSIELDNEWTVWREYTNSFRHRVILGAGNYWQEGFGSRPMYSSRYEHEWNANDRFGLLYGIGRTLHAYDGALIGRNFAYTFLNGRF